MLTNVPRTVIRFNMAHQYRPDEVMEFFTMRLPTDVRDGLEVLAEHAYGKERKASSYAREVLERHVKRALRRLERER